MTPLRVAAAPRARGADRAARPAAGEGARLVRRDRRTRTTSARASGRSRTRVGLVRLERDASRRCARGARRLDGSSQARGAARSGSLAPVEGVALVTGGGRGIGAGIARELARAGMRVAGSARSADQVEQVAGETGGLALAADVSRREEVERLVAEVKRALGPVDLLVANAGISQASAATAQPDSACVRWRSDR